MTDEHLDDDVVRIDLSRPMDEIRAELSKYPVKTRLSLSGPLVVATLAGRKVETRRPAKDRDRLAGRCPFGQPGNRLWVRETWHQCPHCERTVSYRAGGWREAPSGAPDDGGDRCDDDRIQDDFEIAAEWQIGRAHV